MDREEKTDFGKTEEIRERAAEALLSIRAVFLRPEDPFTWASGIRSPIYCDNRLVLSFPSVRTLIEEGIAETVKREYPEAEALFGTATAGIAHAAIAAQFLGLPMGYVRGKAKDHGRKNRIEGRLSKGEGRRHRGSDLHRRLGPGLCGGAPGGGSGGARDCQHLHLWDEEGTGETGQRQSPEQKSL